MLVGDFLWQRVPAGVGRLSPALRAVLTDGRELRVVPVLGQIAPLVALALGLALSATRNPVALVDETYASSVLLLTSFVAISTLGGALGAWAWLGYVIGDLFVVDRFWFALELPEHLLLERLPQALTFLLLFGMMALLPPAVTVIRSQLVSVTGRSSIGRWLATGAAHAAISALFIGAWALAIPALIPPYWTWFGRFTPVVAVATLQDFAWLLALVAAVVTAGRIAALASAEGRGLATGPELAVEPVTGTRRMISVVARSALLSLALAGLADSPAVAALLVGGMLFATLLRSELLPRLTGYVRLINRVPLIARVLGSAAVAAMIGWALLSIDPVQRASGLLSTDSYLVLVVSIVLSAIVAALLMPSEVGGASADEVARS